MITVFVAPGVHASVHTVAYGLRRVWCPRNPERSLMNAATMHLDDVWSPLTGHFTAGAWRPDPRFGLAGSVAGGNRR